MAQGDRVVGKSADVLTPDPAEFSLRPECPSTTTSTELLLAEVLADLMGVEQVPVGAHFFDDLGADSLVMAHFCARLRKRADLPTVSMKDIYRHPTVAGLATAFADAAPASTPAAPSPAAAPAPVAVPATTTQYVTCGVLQLLIFLGYGYLAALVVVRGFGWISAGSGVLDVYLRSLLVGSVGFVGMCALPILVKWVLIGRWKPQQIRAWSLAYVRFWTVKTLIRSNPLVLFVGSPLYVLYLRALGAKIGRGVVIFSRAVPVCTDLLTIGDGTVVRADSFLSCYRAHAGVIQTGAVTLGKDVLVSEATVLDIDTSMGDGAQLGHASSLHAGQAVPAGERWHGSPAQRTDVDYRTLEPASCGLLRRVGYTVLQVLSVLVLYVPLGVGGVTILLIEVPQLVAILDAEKVRVTSGVFYLDAVIISSVLFFGSLLVGLLVVATVPRVLNLVVTPDRAYRLYGFHFWLHRRIAGLTNSKFFTTLFGDSSCIVHYLRYIGYDLCQVEQSGSNFGTMVKHSTPYLSTVGSGTMVADGLSFSNADFSSTSFSVSRTSIGPRNFLGNHIVYPARGRTGENCLLGTKVMVPIDGEVRHGVGLLGSPSFEIPRSVERDSRFDHLKSGPELRRRLAGKNRHNAVTMVGFLLVRWIHVFAIVLLAAAIAELYHVLGALALVLANVLILLFSVAFFALVERAATGFRPQRPLCCSIYDRAFWRHERFWKAAATEYITAFNGTPFKSVVWRLLGVRVGARLFDDGCAIPERTMVTIGDDVTLNAGTIIQCHSQEDGTFKSDRVTIGSGCTVGVKALVHYGVQMGDGVELAPDSFLMKGEEVPPHARWGGNPARELDNGAVVLPAAVTAAPPARPRPLTRAAAVLVPLAVVSGVAVVADRVPDPTSEARALGSPALGSPAPGSPAPAALAPSRRLPPVERPATRAETPPFTLDDLPRLDAGLGPASRGPVVETVQLHLQRLGFYSGPVHGELDGHTRDAVRQFQVVARVADDPRGTVGRSTAIALLAAGGRPQLVVGATGGDTVRLQQALALALGRPLPVTGSFGPMTRQAVCDYQSSRALPVDGIVGILTWAALQQGR
jgi:non-ribosomal peptide synthetase-like protein